MNLKQRSLLRRMVSSVLALLLVVTMLPITASAAAQKGEYLGSGTENGFSYDYFGNGTAAITGYDNFDEVDVKIPAKVGGMFRVVEISDWAFMGYSNMKSVYLPNTLEYIGENAFMSSGLESVTIPGSVGEIGPTAFFDCPSLQEVTILYGVGVISDGAFANCPQLSKVTAGGSIYNIFEGSFEDVSSNLEIVAPAGSAATEITNHGSTITDSRLPDNSVASYKYVVDPDTGEVIVQGYFGDSDTPILPEDINGSTVTQIESFHGNSVTKVTLSPTITTIGPNSFTGTGLKEIEIHSGVNKIEYGAFDDDPNLTIKGSSPALDQYLAHCSKIQFIPYGPNADLYHELKITKEPALGGEIKQGTSRDYRTGMELTIEAVPTQGYLFAGWKTSPTSAEANIKDKRMSLTTFTMPGNNLTLTAKFEKVPPEPLVIRNGVVFAYYGSDQELVIPLEWGKTGQEDMDKVPVTTIGDLDYSSNYGKVFSAGQAKKIYIPQTVTSITSNAFRSAMYVQDIQVANFNPNYSSVDGVLFDKNKTTLLSYPMGKTDENYRVPDGVKKISSYAFNGNPHIKTVDLNQVESVSVDAFRGCSSLTSITMPSVQTIGSNAFYYCTNLAEVSMPSVQTIGGYAFYSCTKLAEVSMPSVQTINSYAFQNCYSLNNVTFPATLASVGSYAFSSCSKLSNIEWADGIELTAIPSGMFQGCSLKSMNIPASVTKIESKAFADNTKLTDVNLPASMTSFASDALLGCTALSAINVEEGNTVYRSEDGILFSADQTRLMIYPPAKVGTAYTVPETVTTVDAGAFGYSKLENVELSNTVNLGAKAFASSKIQSINLEKVEKIGSDAFNSCVNLTEITIPSKVTVLNSSIFEGCTNLTKVILSGAITSIGADAFYGCSKLTDIVLPEGVTSIGSYAFYSCKALKTINIPSTVKTIGQYAFSSCSALTSITIPQQVTSIGQYAFSSCTALQSLELQNCAASIGYSAFYNCTSLLSLEIPDVLASIGEEAFRGCSKLAAVTMNNYSGNIGPKAFYGCTSLKALTIPAGVTSIDSQAFYGCSGLETLNLDSCTASIGSSAFQSCTSLQEVSIPSTVKTVGTQAFYNCSKLHTVTVASETIESSAFSSCTALKNLTLSEGVKTIKTTAFSSCALTSVQLPASLTTFESHVFKGNPIAAYSVAEGSESFAANDGVLYNKGMTTLIVYPSAKAGTSYIAPNTVTEVLSYAFPQANNLTMVELGESVKTLHHSLFYGSNNIKTVRILSRDAAFENLDRTPFEYIFTSMGNVNKMVVEGYFGSTAEYEVFRHRAQGLHFRPIEYTNGVIVNKDGAVVGYTGTDLEVILPSAVTKNTAGVTVVDENGNAVTLADDQIITVKEIKSGAFRNPNDKSSTVYQQITNVRIPLSITKIGMGAFESCSGLSSEKFVLPDSIETIEPYAFRYCEGLTSITIPKNVTVTGGTGVPDEQTGTNVYISAFYGCSNLKEILVDDQNNSYSSVDGVLMNKGQNKIYEVPMAFAGNQEEQPGVYVIPNTVFSIGDSAFRGCSKLNSVVIPASIENIGVNAFMGAFSKDVAVSVTLSEGIVQLSNGAFKDCAGLTEIKIPSTVEQIGDNVFSGCTGIKNYTVAEGNKRYFSKNGLLYGIQPNENNTEIHALVNYPVGRGEKSVVLDGSDPLFVQIYKNAFEGYTSLETITIPDQVQIIQDRAFSGCIALNTVEFPANLNFIGSNAFAGTNLLNVTLPEGIEFIDAYAFANAKIGSVYLPQSLKKIRDFAFYNSSISEIDIPAGVEVVGAQAFNCPDEADSKLVRVTVHGALTQFLEGALPDVEQLTIYGPANSKAFEFQQNSKNIKFVELTA